MPYLAKKFEHLTNLDGFSDQLLANHLTLYEGYVTNVNKLVESLKSKEPGTPDYSELQRRLGWEWNGMRLHELYFDNLAKDPKGLGDESALRKKMDEIWGGVESWWKEFAAIGSMRGIGWAVLYYDPETTNLSNVWITEHDGGHLAGAVPLLVMDVFEHAYMLDYQLKKADYIQTFARSVDWTVVEKRFAKNC